MRLWAEEKRGNTQNASDFPMQAHELVLGKFFASFLFYLIALACTFPIPVMLAVLGHPDLGAILSVISARHSWRFFLAIGTLVGFYRDQIVAFILSMMICFGFILRHRIRGYFDRRVDRGVRDLSPAFSRTGDHYVAFAKGVIDNATCFISGSAARWRLC